MGVEARSDGTGVQTACRPGRPSGGQETECSAGQLEVASAKAFADALANPGFRTSTAFAGAPLAVGGRTRIRRALGAVAWCALGAVPAWIGLQFWSAPAGSKDASRQQITYTGRAGPRRSPDGRFVAFLEQRCPEPPATGGCANLEVLEIGTTSPVEILT